MYSVRMYIPVSMPDCMYVRMHACMYVCMYLCMFVFTQDGFVLIWGICVLGFCPEGLCPEGFDRGFVFFPKTKQKYVNSMALVPMLPLIFFGVCARIKFRLCNISRRTSIFIHSFIPAISIAPLQVLYYSEALPTTARILYRSFTTPRTGNCR